MKRIIEGKAYNTATAVHIASASSSYTDDRNRDHSLEYDLYRTKPLAEATVGHFFLVEVDTLDDDEDRSPTVKFYPTSYDNAHAFASGRSFRLGYHDLAALQVELHLEGVFPTVAEAADETAGA